MNQFFLETLSMNEETFVDIQFVANRYDVAQTSVYRWCRRGQFPRPYKITPGCSRWKLADVLAHEEQSLMDCE